MKGLHWISLTVLQPLQSLIYAKRQNSLHGSVKVLMQHAISYMFLVNKPDLSCLSKLLFCHVIKLHC